jgi:cell division protein FtsB
VWPFFHGRAVVDNQRMRFATVALLVLFAFIQAELWFGKGGLPRVWSLKSQVQAQQQANAEASARNEQLRAEVSDLKEGLEMVEEKARTELGMVKPDEIYVQLTTRHIPVPTPAPSSVASGAP